VCGVWPGSSATKRGNPPGGGPFFIFGRKVEPREFARGECPKPREIYREKRKSPGETTRVLGLAKGPRGRRAQIIGNEKWVDGRCYCHTGGKREGTLPGTFRIKKESPEVPAVGCESGVREKYRGITYFGIRGRAPSGGGGKIKNQTSWRRKKKKNPTNQVPGGNPKANRTCEGDRGEEACTRVRQKGYRNGVGG